MNFMLQISSKRRQGGGGQKFQNFMDIIYGGPLMLYPDTNRVLQNLGGTQRFQYPFRMPSILFPNEILTAP